MSPREREQVGSRLAAEGAFGPPSAVRKPLSVWESLPTQEGQKPLPLRSGLEEGRRVCPHMHPSPWSRSPHTLTKPKAG